MKPHTYVFFFIYGGHHFAIDAIDVTNLKVVFIGQSKGELTLLKMLDGAVRALKTLTKSANGYRGAKWIVNPWLAKMGKLIL